MNNSDKQKWWKQFYWLIGRMLSAGIHFDKVGVIEAWAFLKLHCSYDSEPK